MVVEFLAILPRIWGREENISLLFENETILAVLRYCLLLGCIKLLYYKIQFYVNNHQTFILLQMTSGEMKLALKLESVLNTAVSGGV